MNEAYVEINGVYTKIVTWGRRIDELNQTDEVVVIIPGTHGVVEFYLKFAQTLHDKTDIPVWLLGHAGHNFPKKSTTKFPKFEDHKNLYNLNGQINHKIDFFRKFVPKDAKVHLVAHSIGSYMTVEMLEHPEVQNKIEDAYLLFPVLENMAATKNGKFLNTFIRPILPIILYLSWIFTILPNFFATFLLQVYLFLHNVPRDLHMQSFKELVKPGVLRRTLSLTFEELDHVKDRNSVIVARHKDKIKLYYGRTDHWAPEAYYNNIKKDIPDVDAELTDINHVFIFNDSVDVASTVSNWIKARK